MCSAPLFYLSIYSMVFASNPLSLSVPEPAFESWLRDTGYLEILDQRTTDLHRLNSATTTTTTTVTANSSSTTTSAALNHRRPQNSAATNVATSTTTIAAIAYALTMSTASSVLTILSLFTLNPFAKLTASDFSVDVTLSWTSSGFLGSLDSYSFPSSPTQARMRVHENIKRFARNYATLLILFFACALYQMPIVLIGLLSCLAVWELFRFCDERWALVQFPTTRQVLIRIAQCAVAVILFCSNVQMAVFSALAVGYGVMMLHASFRKLTPAKQPSKGRGR